MALHNQFKLTDNTFNLNNSHKTDPLEKWKGTIVQYIFDTSEEILEALGRRVSHDVPDADDVSIVENKKEASLNLLTKNWTMKLLTTMNMHASVSKNSKKIWK